MAELIWQLGKKADCDPGATPVSMRKGSKGVGKKYPHLPHYESSAGRYSPEQGQVDWSQGTPFQ